MHVSGVAAIVTGAASGLGLATAQALAEDGASVYGFDLGDAVAKAPAIDGVSYLAVDVSVAEEVDEAVTSLAGGSPLRVVVNCAGIAPSMRIVGRSGKHDAATFERVVQVNLVGTFNVMASAAFLMAQLPATRSGERGVIINTASVAAFEGQVGQVAYAASKAGIAGLALPAARDLAQHAIRVNTIAPGILETPMLASVGEEFRVKLAAGIPFPSRLGRPQEFADLVRFLVAHEYINGEVVRLDAGLRMAPR